jgi:hypothetical protein
MMEDLSASGGLSLADSNDARVITMSHIDEKWDKLLQGPLVCSVVRDGQLLMINSPVLSQMSRLTFSRFNLVDHEQLIADMVSQLAGDRVQDFIMATIERALERGVSTDITSSIEDKLSTEALAATTFKLKKSERRALVMHTSLLLVDEVFGGFVAGMIYPGSDIAPINIFQHSYAKALVDYKAAMPDLTTYAPGIPSRYFMDLDERPSELLGGFDNILAALRTSQNIKDAMRPATTAALDPDLLLYATLMYRSVASFLVSALYLGRDLSHMDEHDSIVRFNQFRMPFHQPYSGMSVKDLDDHKNPDTVDSEMGDSPESDLVVTALTKDMDNFIAKVQEVGIHNQSNDLFSKPFELTDPIGTVDFMPQAPEAPSKSKKASDKKGKNKATDDQSSQSDEGSDLPSE